MKQAQQETKPSTEGLSSLGRHELHFFECLDSFHYRRVRIIEEAIEGMGCQVRQIIRGEFNQTLNHGLAVFHGLHGKAVGLIFVSPG